MGLGLIEPNLGFGLNLEDGAIREFDAHIAVLASPDLALL